jgi:ABC-type dipeptide/oligopeptide/nickel transport system permease component
MKFLDSLVAIVIVFALVMFAIDSESAVDKSEMIAQQYREKEQSIAEKNKAQQAALKQIPTVVEVVTKGSYVCSSRGDSFVTVKNVSNVVASTVKVTMDIVDSKNTIYAQGLGLVTDLKPGQSAKVEISGLYVSGLPSGSSCTSAKIVIL